MAGNAQGALKTAASKLQVPLGVYIERRAAGERYCAGCKRWQTREFFYARGTSRCKQCNRVPKRNANRMTELEARTVRELRRTARMTYYDLSKMFGRSQHSLWMACNRLTKVRR